MAIKSENKSKRGGKRPGAGRPLGATSHRGMDRRDIGVEIALGGLERALKAYETRGEDDFFTPEQRMWHLAMVLLGIPPDTIAAALFKPHVSKNFSRDIANAIKAVEASEA